MKSPALVTLVTLLSLCSVAPLSAKTLKFRDRDPKRYELSARASEIDPRARSHPEIEFTFETNEGKPADVQMASVDTTVPPRGKLVIWLMGHNGELFRRLNSYGLHAIQPHYANKWFGIVCQEKPLDPQARGNVRLEASTGADVSDAVDIPKPDSIMERSYQFVKWLARENPEGKWDYFLTDDGKGLRWEDVILSGASHGATTAARFAIHTKVDRVVALCGPRDQDQDWQSLPSATPANRVFGFSHVLDGGWVDDHYCRSWELMGMHEFGPIVDVDQVAFPYGNTRRLITNFDVGGDANKAHSAVTPGKTAAKKPDGTYLHEDVWRYLYTHPVDEVGKPPGGRPALVGIGSTAADESAPPEWSLEFVRHTLADARAHGNVRRGAGVFSAATSGCTACHKVAGAGGAVGPELTTLARCLTPEEIVESVYWPARIVKPEYRAGVFALADGRVLQGIVKEETPTAVVVVDAAGTIHRIPPADIEERTDAGSLMPANVFTSLPAEDRRDLVRYLLELGRTPGLELLSHRAGPFDVPREPLDPAAWPNRGLWVNNNRVYDAYTKQAMQFRGRQPMPLLLPAFPGLDGGTHGHWGSIPWSTWDDDRRNKGDQGTAQCWPLAIGGRVIPRAVSVRLGDLGELAACFNPDTLQVEAVWTGGFLTFGKTRYGFLATANPAGTLGSPPAAAELPEGPRTYHGFYRHGKRVVFAYSIGDVRYLDAPWVKDGGLVREIAPVETHPLAHVVKGGASQWPQVMTTTGSLGTGSPYAVDTIAPPFDNPWGALMFFGGHGFFSNGDAAICTIQGDVWRVSGLDADLGQVRWRRIAAGLNQALGLVVAADVVYLLCGDQLTRLDDLSGDGEADFYACVTNRFEPSGGHNFKCGLERDAAGHFFTASHQGLLRISPDGKAIDVLAVGFRNPDGLGLLPDGAVTVPVSEGEWTPASAICEVRQIVGQPPARPVPNFRGTPPALPLVYLPRGLDHSSGGQTYVSGDRWGPLGGHMIHFSFGACTHFLVLRDEVAGQPQGAIVPLPGDFRSGVHRGRFSPVDGQLYVSGMNGWHVYGVDDGCFQRVRYTGGTVQQPIGIRAHRNGVLLRFSAPLDQSVAGDAANHFAQCWNYRYGPSYGSPEFSPSHSGTVGHDPLAIRSATVLSDGQSLFLETPDIQPVNQLHLHLAIGGGATRDVYATVHALDEPFRDIPNYLEVTRPVAAHPILRDIAMMKAAVKNPWLKKVAGARPLSIEAASNLAYKTPELRAKPGEILALTFVNPDVLPHNWVLVKPDTLATVGTLADGLIADPEAVARHYVPKTDDVIAYADITEPGKSQTIYFTAPDTTGRFPFLCTFPGHWKLMNGVLIVK